MVLADPRHLLGVSIPTKTITALMGSTPALDVLVGRFQRNAMYKISNRPLHRPTSSGPDATVPVEHAVGTRRRT